MRNGDQDGLYLSAKVRKTTRVQVALGKISIYARQNLDIHMIKSQLWLKNIRTLKTLYFKSPPEIKKLMRFGYEGISQLVWTLFGKGAIKKLRESSSRCKTIDDYIDLAFSARFGFDPLGLFVNIRPVQIKGEISQLMKILTKLAPKTVLEIGTLKGGTLYLWTKAASPNATIISIDLPGSYPKRKISFYKSFGSASQKIYLLRADSHSETTLHRVERILRGRKVDFLFIDGDHSYEGVKNDFQMYAKLVKSGGIVAFHDIVPGPSERVGNVSKFWDEIKQNFRYIEIVEDWNQDGYGIGVIYIK